MPKTMTYDSACYDLAAQFLSDEEAALNTEANRKILAGEIQTCIEAEIDLMRRTIEEKKK